MIRNSITRQQSLYKYFAIPSFLNIFLTVPDVRAFGAPRLETRTNREQNHNIKSHLSMFSDPLSRIGLPSPLILGSGSFTRKLILNEMGIPFELFVRKIDEKNIGNRDGDARTLVTILSNKKMDVLLDAILNNLEEGGQNFRLPQRSGIANDKNDWIIMTADQVVTHEGSILEKPINIEEARSFVSGYAKAPPSTVGSVTLCHIPSNIRVTGVDSATIRFFPSVAETEGGKDLVQKLLEDNAPILSCAGGLMVEHPLVKEHIEKIEGTEASVMGLSKELVLHLLKELKTKLDKL